MKRCSRCREHKEYECFSKDKSRKDGHSNYCKQCRADLKKVYVENNKEFVYTSNRKYTIRASNRNRDMVRKLKEETPCADCGKNYPYYCMDFDHKGDEKNFNVSAYGTRSWGSIQREIALCDIVCVICHRYRTHRRGYFV